MTRFFALVCAVFPAFSFASLANAAACTASSYSDVLTGQNDNFRTSSNLKETVLTPSNVASSSNSFGYLFSIPVSAAPVFAQPLVVHNITIGGKTYCSVVYVAGMDNSIYAFDGDTQPTATSPYIWKTAAFGTPVTFFSGKDTGFKTGGILSTPAIDIHNGILYFTSLAEEGSGSAGWTYRIHAISLQTGAEFFGGDQPQQSNPIGGTAITASVPGTGDDSTAGVVSFVASHHFQRPSLLNVNGTVYIGFGFGTPTTNFETEAPYHGWMFAYKSCLSTSTTCAADPPCYTGATCTLQQISVFNTTPDSHGAGIWMSGRGPTWDGGSNVYIASANACIKGSNPLACPAQESGESVLNLSTGDFFAPAPSWITTLDYNDLDLDSGGLLMIPPAAVAGVSAYAVAGTKSGGVYLLQTAGLGGQTATPYQGFQAAGANAQCPNNLPAYNQPPLGTGTNTGYCDEIHSLTYWNQGSTGLLYVWAFDDVLRAYGFNYSGNSLFNTSPAATYVPSKNPGNGGLLAISANNKTNAILWSVTAQASFAGAALSAFQVWNPTTNKPVLQKLWDSSVSGTDFFTAQRFVQPVISNGKVYVTTGTKDSQGNTEIFVYGLCSAQTAGCQVQP